MKMKLLVLSAILVLSFSGCGKNEPTEIKPLPIPEPIAVIEEPEPEDIDEPEPEEMELEFSPENMLNGVPIIGVREVINGKFQSYLTGVWKDVDVSTRRPMALVMPNNKAALPHYAISRADIVFEAAVEGRTSRLIAFFEDYDDLDHIGPTRSARDYYVYEAMGKLGFFCHWGLAIPYSLDLINSEKVDNVSVTIGGIKRGGDEAFKRIPRPGYSKEFTAYLDVSGYNKALDRLGYELNYPGDFKPQFIFAADKIRVTYDDYPDATYVAPGGAVFNAGGFGDGKSYFEYNEEDFLYYRYQYGGKHSDEMNNEHLAYSNIVFQYAHGEQRDKNDYLAFGVHGGDKAIVFTNGKVIEGTWERRGGDLTPARFYDLSGNEIIFNQGKTWICLIWKDFAEFVAYE